jgi:Nif-specific regulatory protein
MGMIHGERREVRELRLLYRLSRLLAQSLDLREALQPVLAALARHMGLERGTVSLSSSCGEIAAVVAHGREARPSGGEEDDLLGRAVCRVLATGEPVIQRRSGAFAPFLPGEDLAPVSLLCVPLKSGTRLSGTLSAVRAWDPDGDPEEDLRLLSIVGSMIAQAVDLRRRAEQEQRQLHAENERLKAELRRRFHPDNIVGTSPGMRAVYEDIATVSPALTTVLIEGESGTGKELVAQAIHYNSPRSSGPFIKVHCGALPESLIESELFGHVRGAFTGATADRPGRFELAHRGTLFLDEVGDIPTSIQIKLLRVLQERELERVGSARTLEVDARLIASTNRDLLTLVEQGRFREDLYYRLCVFPIRVPPLRKRKGDVPALVEYLLARLAMASGRAVPELGGGVLEMLLSYHWPGNVRELEACLERAVLVAQNGVIRCADLPPTLQTAEATGTGPPGSLRFLVESYERDLLADALETSGGNMAAAARTLGCSQRMVSYKTTKYGL